ncbi:MAG: hypothetical protein JW969_14780, partial [Spirochaetales bacterium]|nr:hypothetical protein [Spirochaetales bacterium]
METKIFSFKKSSTRLWLIMSIIMLSFSVLLIIILSAIFSFEIVFRSIGSMAAPIIVALVYLFRYYWQKNYIYVLI